MSQPTILFVDLFCGAGGTTSGVERSRVFGNRAAKVLACVNHDANAIMSHSANHPDCVHFTEDIRTLDLTGLISICRTARRLYPGGGDGSLVVPALVLR